MLRDGRWEQEENITRIAGVDLPNDKRIEIGLTYIFGIGRATSNEILSKADARIGIETGVERILSPLLPLADYLEAEGIGRLYPVNNANFQAYLKQRLPGIEFTAGAHCQAVVLGYDTELTYAKLADSS